MTPLDPKDVRKLILRQSRRAHVGHIGSALSVVELLCAVYGGPLQSDPLQPAGRDRFVLSKGHAALALYAILHLRGELSAEQLGTFCADGSELGVHPEHRLAGVDFSTGSLGMGLGFAAGSALASRLRAEDWRVFALLSDGECNEGSVWEAAMFAGHHRLGRLTALIDCNGQQALGTTRSVLDPGDVASRWESCGWEAVECDGHDVAALRSHLLPRPAASARPRVILARTLCGRGVSYMERQVKWHYWPMDDREFAHALDEVEAAS